MNAYAGGRVTCLGLPGGDGLHGQNEAKSYKGLPLVGILWNGVPSVGCDELVPGHCLEMAQSEDIQKNEDGWQHIPMSRKPRKRTQGEKIKRKRNQ